MISRHRIYFNIFADGNYYFPKVQPSYQVRSISHIMKNSALFVLLILSSSVTAPSPTFAAIPQDMRVESEPKYSDLYFSEEPMVEATSRYPKSLSRIAENVTVISAAEIEAANIHTLAELLDRVSGVFVSFNGHDFGSSATLLIHGGSTYHNHHTLVLLDGVKLNYNSSGTAETNSIPVGIIERVEVVKGPASSAWGSALGGVINIITKKGGKSGRSRKALSLSYGEANSFDGRAEAGGKEGKLGYYLYGGTMQSDGLRDNRYFENQSFYGKFQYHLPRSQIQITGGYTDSDFKLLDMPAMDLSFTNLARDWFTTATFTGSLAADLSLTVSASYLDRSFLRKTTSLSTGDIVWNLDLPEKSYGFETRLVKTTAQHTLAFGIDYHRNELEQRIISALPPDEVATPALEERWAVYLNDTASYGALTVISGMRYDYHSISGDFISPSLGLVYRYRPDTLFRASVARGFSAPPLINVDGGGDFFSLINPDLDPEEVWSFQFGIETTALRSLRLKTTIFYHDLEGIWERNALDQLINSGNDQRQGFEIELETLPVHNLALTINLTSIYQDTETLAGLDEDHLYNANIILTYDQPGLFRAELFGHYVWLLARESNNGSYSDFLWDLNLSRKFTFRDGRRANIYTKIHNLFNGSQYWSELIPNPERWVEAGFQVSF